MENIVDVIRAMHKTLPLLLPRERAVIEMRFGIKLDRPSTLEEVGRHFGVTRERIRQIEAKVLEEVLGKMSQQSLKNGSLCKI